MNQVGRVLKGVDSLAGYAEIFRRNVKLSGIVPQISLIMGPCAGGAVYSPAITDFVIMTKSVYMFVTGPEVVREVTNENVTSDELGGAQVHNERSGVAHFLVEDEHECFKVLRNLLSFIPSNNLESPPVLLPKMIPKGTMRNSIQFYLKTQTNLMIWKYLFEKS